MNKIIPCLPKEGCDFYYKGTYLGHAANAKIGSIKVGGDYFNSRIMSIDDSVFTEITFGYSGNNPLTRREGIFDLDVVMPDSYLFEFKDVFVRYFYTGSKDIANEIVFSSKKRTYVKLYSGSTDTPCMNCSHCETLY